MTTKINNSDLRINKYTIEELETNIAYLSMTTIDNTQKLTPTFCVKYILNEDYSDCTEEEFKLNFWYVLGKQPHITQQELDNAYDEEYN